LISAVINISFFILAFSFFLFEMECHYAVQAGLELMMLLPQSPECWNYKRAPPHLAFSCFLKFAQLKQDIVAV
jgi:hypothetical protein